MEAKEILMRVAWCLSGIGFSTWFLWPVIKLFRKESFLDALQTVGLVVLSIVLLLIGLSIIILFILTLVWFGIFIYSVLTKQHLYHQNIKVYWFCWLVVGFIVSGFLTLIWYTRTFLSWMIPNLALDVLFAVPYSVLIVILVGPLICIAFVLAYIMHLLVPMSIDSENEQASESLPEEKSTLKTVSSSQNQLESTLEIKIIDTNFHANN